MPGWVDAKLSALDRLRGYNSGTDISANAGTFRLDHNENWHLQDYEMRDIVTEAIGKLDIRMYPQEGFGEVLGMVAKRFGVPRESVILTSGADQGLDLLCQAFLKGEEPAYIVGPTFSFYELRAALAGSKVKSLMMNRDLRLPLGEILSLKDGGLLFVCSPNNPTGNQFPRTEILEAIDSFDGLVVLDEAYADFASYDLTREAQRRRNLVVVRTFSKAFGMAGLRLGCLLANPELARVLGSRVQYPYPVSSLSLAVAEGVLGRPELIRKGVESTVAERGRLVAELRRLDGIEALDSQANFIFASTPLESEVLQRKLLERQVAVKALGDVLGMTGCVRITVGTREMDDRLLEALREVLFPA